MIFKGFDRPTENYSKLPHSLIDSLPEMDTVAEIKVVLYLLRHTWGFSEFGKPKKLTTDEFANGRKRKDQSRMDAGTGLSDNSVRAGLAKAVEHGFILVETDESDKARIEKWYCLNMGDDSNIESRGANFEGLGANFAERTEKETIERKETEISNSDQTQSKHFTAKELEQANAKMDAILAAELKPLSIREAMKSFPFNVKWDSKQAREFMEWVNADGITPQQITRAAEIWRSDKQFNWQVPTLSLVFEKWPALMQSMKDTTTTPVTYNSEGMPESW